MIKTRPFKHQIDVARNESLEDLFWRAGEVIGFNGISHNEREGFDSETPFVLAIPEKIVLGYQVSNRNAMFLSHFQGSEIKRYTLIPRGDILLLKNPKRYIGPLSDSLYQNFNVYARPKKGECCYPFERAYSGKDALREAFNSMPDDFYFYGRCLDSSKLNVERTKIERFFERLGLGKFLKNQLRFEN